MSGRIMTSAGVDGLRARSPARRASLASLAVAIAVAALAAAVLLLAPVTADAADGYADATTESWPTADRSRSLPTP